MKTAPLSTITTKLLRLLVYAHPGTLNIHYLKHRLNLKVEPREEADSLVGQGLIELLPGSDPPEWRATRKGIWLDENAAAMAVRTT